MVVIVRVKRGSHEIRVFVGLVGVGERSQGDVVCLTIIGNITISVVLPAIVTERLVVVQTVDVHAVEIFLFVGNLAVVVEVVIVVSIVVLLLHGIHVADLVARNVGAAVPGEVSWFVTCVACVVVLRFPGQS